MTLMDAIVWTQRHSILVVVTVFTLIVVSTYWPGRKKSIERHGRIPLEDDR